ncbi:MAG: hypothetical protein JW995_15130 [Melioribacteraceae bacterium]|nr:hypothetical protein [Melioribacteraceae bacterium]
MKMRIVFVILLTFFAYQMDAAAQDTTKVKENNKKNANHGAGFIDLNGDGYNDKAPDHDGDGIPNGLDPDYQKMKRERSNKKVHYIDLNGDGVNDNMILKGKGKAGKMNFNKQLMNSEKQGENVRTQQTKGKNGTGKGGKK